MRLLLTLLLLVFLDVASAQEFYPVKSTLFNWNPFDQFDKKSKTDFINRQKKYFIHFINRNDYSRLTMEDLHNSLHFIDLNKDGIFEVIFDGASEAEGDETMIFQKINNQYQRVFSGRQSIVDIKWESNGETKIYISDFGCCAEYTVTNKIFKLTQDENKKIKLVKTYQSLSFFEGPKPDSIFSTPIKFKVLVDNYKLRHTPTIDDTSFQPWNYDTIKPVGNVISNLTKNSIGYALGYKTDKSGRQWWYVEMDEKSIFKNTKLYAELVFPSKLIGWVSSNYLEKQ